MSLQPFLFLAVFAGMDIMIRNMVCRHCIAAVRNALHDVGFDVVDVELGHAVVADESVSASRMAELDSRLSDLGFERVDDSDTATVERVKHAIIGHVRNEDECHRNLSACLEEQIGVGYGTLSRMFSRIEHRTIEKYHIAQKIEYVKELLVMGCYTLSEIAFRADYSSVAHLSRQFKDVTGMTPTQYLKSGIGRKPINEI